MSLPPDPPSSDVSTAPIPHFDLPLNLPHAATVAERILRLVVQRGHTALLGAATVEILETLRPYHEADENPADPHEAEAIVAYVAALGRALTNDIERFGVGEDRLGQCIRNLFECLALGEEGARLSLRAGENPNSVQRPV